MRDPVAINLSWLLRLRWLSILGQAVVIALVEVGLGVDLPLPALAAVLALAVGSNLVAGRWLASGGEVVQATIGGLMALDVLLLTGIFLCTGGPYNPFTSLYVVNIALAAVILRPAWTWGLLGLSMACFALLFAIAMGQPAADPSGTGVHAHGHGGTPDQLRLHLEGMWLSLALAAALIVYFVQRVTRALAERERELDEARTASLRSQRLASLATLAAGAAHELATPLSTIAVVARELERSVGQANEDGASTLEDVRLIRDQVDRCRGILDQMAADSGEISGEDWSLTSPQQLLDETLADLPARDRVRTRVEGASAEGPAALALPRRAVGRAIRNLVKNALQASPGEASVDLEVHGVNGGWEIRVVDRGTGMAPEVLARAGEPFFTTKSPGRGMGLGLFLARAVCEQLGGSISLDSRPGEGTSARLVLAPRRPATIGRIDTGRPGMPEGASSWSPAVVS